MLLILMVTEFILVFLATNVIVCPAVSGCGQLPSGRERTINFTVSDFKLPAVMTYTADAGAKASVPTISSTKSDAETFVRRLIMQSVEDVLYDQGRSAFLTDNVITSILQQLNVQISYEPLNCIKVIIDPTMNNPNAAMNDMINCVIIDRTVTNICIHANNGCMDMAMIAGNLKPIPPAYLSISGSLKTSNAIMANWSNQMWQSVLNRVLRRITSSQNGAFFFGASVNIN